MIHPLALQSPDGHAYPPYMEPYPDGNLRRASFFFGGLFSLRLVSRRYDTGQAVRLPARA
jgi:hypothetical protein